MKSWREELAERLDRACDPHTEVAAGLGKGIDRSPLLFWVNAKVKGEGDEVMAKAKAVELSPKEQVKAKRADLIERLTALLGEVEHDLTMVRVHRLLAEAREQLRTA